MSNVAEFDAAKFYLGSLCKRSHDWNSTGKSLRYKPSRIGTCVECHKIIGKAYALNHPEKCRKARRKYEELNPEKVAESRRKYRLNNPEKIKANSQKFALLNPEKVRGYRLASYYRHHENRTAKHREYMKTEEGRKANLRAAYKRRAKNKSVHAVEISAQQKSERLLEFNHQCAYCEKTLDTSDSALYHWDHFIALSQGGSDCIGNFVPACIFCNLSKWNRDPWQWYSKQSFFSKKRWCAILKVLGKTHNTYNQLPLF